MLANSHTIKICPIKHVGINNKYIKHVYASVINMQI